MKKWYMNFDHATPLQQQIETVVTNGRCYEDRLFDGFEVGSMTGLKEQLNLDILPSEDWKNAFIIDWPYFAPQELRRRTWLTEQEMLTQFPELLPLKILDVSGSYDNKKAPQ